MNSVDNVLKTTKGFVSFHLGVSYEVGNDTTFQFGKTLCHMSGEPLKLSPGDLIYRLRIRKPDPGRGQQQVIEETDKVKYSVFLPACLFDKQARKGNTVFFKKIMFEDKRAKDEDKVAIGCKVYELELEPKICNSGKAYSFDECAYVASLPCKNQGFPRDDDIPEYYNTIFESDVFYYHYFSPETKQIHLDQVGVSPFGSDTLKASVFERIWKVTNPICYRKINEKSITFTTAMCGRNDPEDEANRVVALDKVASLILLDKNHLYVLHKQSTFVLDEDNRYVLQKGSTLTSFMHKVIEDGLLADSKVKIDESGIVATSLGRGVVQIYIPIEIQEKGWILQAYEKKALKQNGNVLFSSPDLFTEHTLDHLQIESPNTTDTIPTPTPSVTNTTVACNVGWGKILGVCCEPAWADAPIAFKAINGKEWYGQVPMDKDYKFVILENGKPVAWENGNNRRCKDNILNIPSGQVNF